MLVSLATLNRYRSSILFVHEYIVYTSRFIRPEEKRLKVNSKITEIIHFKKRLCRENIHNQKKAKKKLNDQSNERIGP